MGMGRKKSVLKMKRRKGQEKKKNRLKRLIAASKTKK
jgi:hypothetical protein